jgi:hypothetical protein
MLPKRVEVPGHGRDTSKIFTSNRTKNVGIKLEKSKLMKSLKYVLLLFFSSLFYSGCAIGDFTSYSGQQQNWPTQPGAFVATKYVIPAYIHSWPDRPYIVLGIWMQQPPQFGNGEQLHSQAEELRNSGRMQSS